MFSISRSGSGQVQRVYTWCAGIRFVHAYVVQNGVEQDGDSVLFALSNCGVIKMSKTNILNSIAATIAW